MAISKIRKIPSVNGIFTKKRGLLHIPTCSSRPTDKHFLVLLLLLLLLLLIIIIINNNDIYVSVLARHSLPSVQRRLSLTDASDP